MSVKGGQNVTTSDANGIYKITLSSPMATQVFSYIGFKAIEIPANNRTGINVLLLEASKVLDDVVVAYGSTTQRSSTGALQAVNANGDIILYFCRNKGAYTLFSIV